MRLSLLCFLGCLLLFSGACTHDDPSPLSSGFDLIDPKLDELHDPQSPEHDGESLDAALSGVDIGEACTSDSECNLGRCIVDDGFVDGYCSTPDSCEFDAQCPEADSCFASSDGAFCGARCHQDSHCRDGYRCQESPASSFKVCAPETLEPLETEPDGAACTRDAACAGSFCSPSPYWPGGHCTTLECETSADCANGEGANSVDNHCLVQPDGVSFCMRICLNNEGCRDDYLCEEVGFNLKACLPDPTADVDLHNLDDYPFEITCGLASTDGLVSIDYEVAPDTTSYMIVPFALDGKTLLPLRTDLPDGNYIDYQGANSFQSRLRFASPLITPVLERFSEQLQSGAHRLELSTESENICYYLLEESTPGDTLDFNIYLVGVGMSAREAETSADIQAVLDHFDTLYSQAGIAIGEVRFHEITGEDADAYQIIRSQDDLGVLASLSTLPDGGYDGALSANIFFVRGILLNPDKEQNPLGLSLALPGPAGLHGTPVSAVVFTTEFVGESFEDWDYTMIDGNHYTGIVMGHEIGHYLGLYHTTEIDGAGFDPVLDTAECPPADFPFDCQDGENLMFPYADITLRDLSAGQIFTVQANPLTKD